MQLFHAQHTHDFVNKCDFVAQVDEQMKQFANHEQIMDALRSMDGVNQVFDADAQTSLLVLPSALSPTAPGPCKPSCKSTHRARPEALASVHATDEPFDPEQKPPRKRPAENVIASKPTRPAKKSLPLADPVAGVPPNMEPEENTIIAPAMSAAAPTPKTPKTPKPVASTKKPAVPALDDLWT